MTEFAKFIILIVLLVTLTSLTSANQENDDEEDANKLFTGVDLNYKQVYQAAKSLFGKKKVQSVASTLKRLEILRDRAENEGINLPMSVNKLLALNEASQMKCQDFDYLHEMFDTMSSVKFNHLALTGYVEDCIRRQMALCDFTKRTINSIENYEKTNGWAYLRELNRYVKKFGFRVSDPGPGQLKFRLNNNQLRDSLQLMSKSTKSHIENLVLEMRAVCYQLFDREKMLRMTLKDPNLSGNKEAKRLLKYLGLCQLLARAL